MFVVTDSSSAWVQLITDNFITLGIGDADDGFRGSLQRCGLGGGVSVTLVGTDRSRVLRTARGVRADGCDDLLLLVPVAGSPVVRQEGTARTVPPGAASVHVAERPYELEFAGPSRVVVLQAPRRIVPSPDLVSVRRLTADHDRTSGIVGVFRAFAMEVVARGEALSADDREELGRTAAELAVSVLRSRAVDVDAVPDAWQALVAAVRSHVRANLADPGLTPAVLARHHHVSVRSLQLAFERAGSTPAGLVRTERLRWACRLLADPRYAALPVTAVAARAGYLDVNTFIRAFRRAHGTTPGAWRTQARVPTGTDPVVERLRR